MLRLLPKVGDRVEHRDFVVVKQRRQRIAPIHQLERAARRQLERARVHVVGLRVQARDVIGRVHVHVHAGWLRRSEASCRDRSGPVRPAMPARAVVSHPRPRLSGRGRRWRPARGGDSGTARRRKLTGLPKRARSSSVSGTGRCTVWIARHRQIRRRRGPRPLRSDRGPRRAGWRRSGRSAGPPRASTGSTRVFSTNQNAVGMPARAKRAQRGFRQRRLRHGQDQVRVPRGRGFHDRLAEQHRQPALKVRLRRRRRSTSSPNPRWAPANRLASNSRAWAPMRCGRRGDTAARRRASRRRWVRRPALAAGAPTGRRFHCSASAASSGTAVADGACTTTCALSARSCASRPRCPSDSSATTGTRDRTCAKVAGIERGRQSRPTRRRRRRQ